MHGKCESYDFILSSQCLQVGPAVAITAPEIISVAYRLETSHSLSEGRWGLSQAFKNTRKLKAFSLPEAKMGWHPILFHSFWHVSAPPIEFPLCAKPHMTQARGRPYMQGTRMINYETSITRSVHIMFQAIRIHSQSSIVHEE